MRALIVVVMCGCGSGAGEWSGQAVQIAVGGTAACALDDSGQVACWGNGAVLQRGAIVVGANNECVSPFIPGPTLSACVSPVALTVDTEQRFVEISAGWSDTFCGRTAAGVVHCWPSFYPPCEGTLAECSKSVDVSTMTTFTSITGAHHGVYGIAADGRGYRATIGGSVVALAGDHQFTEVRGGDNAWVGLDATGSVWQADVGSTPPEQLGTIAGVTKIAAAGTLFYRNGCAIDGTGALWCWGSSVWGQLGDGTFTGRPEAAPIASGSKYKDVATSGIHVCAVTVAGDVDCWGWNSRGQVGVTTQMCPDPADPNLLWPCTDHPVHIPLPRPAVSVGVSGSLSCAVLSDHTVWCWGINTWGQLGRGSVSYADGFSPDPAQVQ